MIQNFISEKKNIVQVDKDSLHFRLLPREFSSLPNFMGKNLGSRLIYPWSTSLRQFSLHERATCIIVYPIFAKISHAISFSSMTVKLVL